MKTLYEAGNAWNVKNGGISNDTKFEKLDKHEYDLIGFFADFIIEDRKRIVKPLADHMKGPIDDNAMIDAIEETLKNAGMLI